MSPDRRPTLAQDLAGIDIVEAPDFNIDRVRGDALADYVRQLHAASHQVKADYRAVDTGRLYFECMDDPGATGARWRPSGWRKCDAAVWTHVVGFVTISLPVWVLSHVCEYIWEQRNAFRQETRRGSCPTQGVCPPFDVFLEVASDFYRQYERGELTPPTPAL